MSDDWFDYLEPKYASDEIRERWEAFDREQKALHSGQKPKAAKPLDVTCPKCKAGVGEPCKMLQRAAMKVHHERNQAARDA